MSKNTNDKNKKYCTICGEYLVLDCCEDCYECNKDDIIECDDLSMMLHMIYHRKRITDLKEEISPYIYKMNKSTDVKKYCTTCNDNDDKTLLFNCCGYCPECAVCENKNEECDSNRHYVEKYSDDEENMMIYLLEHRSIIRELKQEIAELKANK